jgi:hypothetical protein
MERAGLCPMWLSATRRSADGRREVAPIATLRSSASPTNWQESCAEACQDSDKRQYSVAMLEKYARPTDYLTL